MRLGFWLSVFADRWRRADLAKPSRVRFPLPIDLKLALVLPLVVWATVGSVAEANEVEVNGAFFAENIPPGERAPDPNWRLHPSSYAVDNIVLDSPVEATLSDTPAAGGNVVDDAYEAGSMVLPPMLSDDDVVNGNFRLIPAEIVEHFKLTGRRVPAVLHDNGHFEEIRIGDIRSRLDGQVSPHLSLADAAGLSERESYVHNADYGREQPKHGNEEHSKRPYRHILLGLQVILGTLFIPLCLYLAPDAVKAINDGVSSFKIFAGIVGLIVCSIGIMGGGMLAMIGLALLVF